MSPRVAGRQLPATPRRHFLPLLWMGDMLRGVSDTPRSPDPGPHRHLPESHWLRQPLPAEADLVLTGADLSIADVEAVARSGRRVSLGPEARGRVDEARAVIERLVEAGEIV